MKRSFGINDSFGWKADPGRSTFRSLARSVGGSPDMLTLCANEKAIPCGLLPVPDVARVLGVHEAQVVDWCKRGVIASQLYGGKSWIRTDTLEHFINGCKWLLVAIPDGELVPGSFNITEAGRATLTGALEGRPAD